MTASRYTVITVDHFQQPRNVGRMPDADRTARVDDAASETTITLYVKLSATGEVRQCSFRTFGCSACIAASSVATELLIGRAASPTAADIDQALGGLPAEKRYCAELVAAAAAQLFGSH